MRKHFITNELTKKLNKLSKKNWKDYEAVLKKIDEIIHCSDIHHYKNLRRPMNRYKRVHVNKSFILIFEFNDYMISFINYKHHDKAYKD